MKEGRCVSGVQVKDSMVRILVGAGLLVMLSACQTSKHTEVMSNEDVPQREQAAVIESEQPSMDKDSFGGTERFPEETRDAMDGFEEETVTDVPPPAFPGDRDQMEEQDSGSMTEMERMEQDAETFGFSHVFFDFDKYTIRHDAIPTLRENARLLKNRYQDAGVLIEGHCDERGTVEYNLELGKRRAQAVKDYLIDLGVPESRVRIVSYGKERPFCMTSEPVCWQQNRRGHFLLQQ